VQPAQATEGHAVIAVIVRLVGLLLHGQGDQFGGPVVVSLLMTHDPEQVQRPGMLRVSLENAAIQRLGLGEPPGLVQSDRDRKWVGGGFHGLIVSLNDDNALIDNRPTHGFFPNVLDGMSNLSRLSAICRLFRHAIDALLGVLSCVVARSMFVSRVI
jgi:hypothetical protein